MQNGLIAYRHPITSQAFFQTPEEKEAYERHCREVHASLAPAGGMEIISAQDIADTKWRLKRADLIESGLLAMDAAPEQFARLLRYRARIEHHLAREIKALNRMQKQRKSADANSQSPTRKIGLHLVSSRQKSQP